MKAVLVLAAVILYGGCSATPAEVSNMKKPSQNENSEAAAVSSNSARAAVTTSSQTKTSSKSSVPASVGNSAQSGNQESSGFARNELKNSAGFKSGGIKGQNNFGGRGPVGFGDQESDSDYGVGKNFPYGGYDSDGEYEEQDDGFSNQEEGGNYNDIDVNSQSRENARGDIGRLSAAVLFAHHAHLAHLAHLLHLSHHLSLPEIIGLNFLTRGVPGGGGLMNLWPLHHLTNHKLKELMYFNALPNLTKTNIPGHGKAIGLQSPGLQMTSKGWKSQDAKRFQAEHLIY